MSGKVKVIAFYLPQFHPLEENDRWWGKGFTEWTNVGKAKKYYPGHYQPRVPADLGYYDLRIPEVRESQALLAKEAGISAFCYWHYWFGNGKQLLEMPLQEVVRLGKPNFPFCLGWANHDWSKKNWNKDVSRFSNEVLIKQTYPGKEDIDAHFFTMLPAFNDKRYYTINGKLLFYIYAIDQMPEAAYFLKRWQELARQNGLPEFYFVCGCSDRNKIGQEIYLQCDATNLDLKAEAFFMGGSNWWRRISYLSPFPVNKRSYKHAVRKWNDAIYETPGVYPTIYPNWDHSPRVGKSATILHGSTPQLFKQHVINTIKLISGKEEKDRIIFLKSWNEWAEGNYMEPDLRFGRSYIESLRAALEESENG